MPLTGPDFIGNMDSANPIGTDSKTIADDQMRNIQEGCRMTFPNVKGQVPGSHTDIGICTGRGFTGIRALTGVAAATEIYMHNQVSPPQGYTLISNTTERMLTAAASSTVPGGSEDPTNMTGLFSGALTEFEDVQHLHSLSSGMAGPTAVVNVDGPGSYGVATNNHHHTGTTDQQSINHRHSLANANIAVTFQPRYYRGILVRMT